jgi:hypothetical protein
MRALAGLPETAAMLRYKKKMMMWSFPGVGGSSSANGGSSTHGDDGVVGYSLMTFVLRNGLPALRQGAATYAAYVDNLVRRSWGLPRPLAAQVRAGRPCTR